MKNKHLSGIIQGMIIGALFTLAVTTVCILGLISVGYVRISTNGQIYVQDIPTDSGDGIGSLAEKKLNTLEDGLASFYFDEVDKEKLIDGICKGYLSAFGDRYTTYYSAEEYKKLEEIDNGEYCGIGVVVRKNDDGTINMVEIYDGSPAKDAGLQPNDAIVSVNGTSVADLDLNSVVADIKGAEGTYVELEIRREGVASTFNVSLKRQKVEVKSVVYEMLPDSIGLISVSEFSKATTSQFLSAYNALNDQGMKALIVDVRSNPGGMLSSVVNMLDAILPDGLIVYTEDKYGKRTEYKGSNKSQINIPMAVLVNGESASASEIFAGAIQDYGVGTIIGTKTFGKGIVQTIRPLSDGSAIKFTTSKYYTPKGQDIHMNGVKPDIEVELSEEFMQLEEYDKEKDNQLQAAIENVKSKMN